MLTQIIKDNMTDLNALYTPVLPPAPLGEATAPAQPFNEQQQAMAKGLTGSDPAATTPTLPVGTGNTMYTGPMFNQGDISNVGGVTGMAPQEDTQTYIPETVTSVDAMTQSFHDAADKTRNITDGRGKTKEITGRKMARRAKGEARREDRRERRAEGLSGGEKRRRRRGQRRSRKEAWKNYKADEAYEASL